MLLSHILDAKIAYGDLRHRIDAAAIQDDEGT